MSELPPVLAGAQAHGPTLSGPLVFRGRARDIFSKNGLLALLCGLSVVGIPYAAVLFYRWLARKTESANGNKFTFLGGVGAMYALVGCMILIAVCFRLPLLMGWLGPFQSHSAMFAVLLPLLLLQAVANGVVGFFYLRYFFGNIADIQNRKIGIEVPLLGYIGFNLTLVVSFFTIIGWAWVTTCFYRWVFRRLRIEGAEIQFTGAGLSLLWRTFVATVCCLPLVTMPWAMAWFYRWLISKIEIRHAPATA